MTDRETLNAAMHRVRRPVTALALVAILVVPAACREPTGTTSTSGSTSGSTASTSSAGSTSSASSSSTDTTASSSDSSSSVGGAGSTSTSDATSTSTASGTGGAGGTMPVGTPARLVAGNLTSGSNQTYTNGEGIRILQGIHGDILMLQEFNYGSNLPADFQDFTETVCGMECSWVRGPDVSNGIPNAVISRWTFVSSGSWADPYVANRDFVWARIDIPGPADLWAVSVHLLTTSATDRANEATALMNLLAANVPAGDLVVVGGDFNTKTRVEPALTNFDPVFQVLGPYPADQAGNDNTSMTRTRPYDWVMVSDGLQALATSTHIGMNTFAAGAVIDTRVYTPISDLAPAFVTDSAEASMQHMAVVRDFLLPAMP